MRITPGSILVAALFGSVLIFGAEPAKPRIVGHADGEIAVSLSLCIVDAATSAPVAGARVACFTAKDVALLDLIESEKKRSEGSAYASPQGTCGVTGKEGKVTLRCWLDAAFLEGFVDGRLEHVGTDIYPGGKLMVVSAGFMEMERKMREVFSQAPYTPEQLARTTILRLVRR